MSLLMGIYLGIGVALLAMIVATFIVITVIRLKEKQE